MRDIKDFNEKRKKNFDILLVDEASMIPQDVFQHLMSLERHIIYFGDHGQLPPIKNSGTVSVMDEKNLDFRLETIHRNAGDIKHFGHWLNAGKMPHEFRCTDGSVRFISTASRMIDLDKKTQFICGTNKTRVALNDDFREHLGLSGPPRKGDRLISLKNDVKQALSNGTMISPHRVDGRSLYYIDRANCERVITYDPLYLRQPVAIDTKISNGHPFDFGFAITCHKSQGSEFDIVSVKDECGFMFYDHGEAGIRRWRYTAATRAQKQLFWW